MKDLFGQEVSHANPSRPRATNSAIKMSATYGLSRDDSSPSAVLQRFLENKLRESLTGSVSCEVIWKSWRTPWGPSRSRPRAQAVTISEIDIGMWPTMTSNSPAKPGRNEGGNSCGQDAIRKIILALWPTTRANEGTGAQVPPNRQGGVALKTMVTSMWSTIRASDGEKGGPNMSFGAGGSPLPSQVSTVGNMSNAPTENGGGSLHPEFAGWELGYPPVWLSCAPSGTQSTIGRRRSSSALTPK